ncbi:2'-5' RNA ligase family protein [Candidatus Woesebacteria bacterium]|nr:2'-5' RNA ligase family protein [Candidatus Woesebacteria bacterium]
MERLIFERDDRDRMMPLYVKHSILTPEPILQLQHDIARSSHSQLVPVDELHLTLFYFGRPDSLYQDVVSQHGPIEFEDFMKLLQEFLSSLTLPTQNFSADVHDLALFGTDDVKAMVLRLKKNPQLLALRQLIISRFHEFLNDCLIEDIPTFMRGSRNLEFQLEDTYNPHITFCYGCDDIDWDDVRGIPSRLILSPPHIFHVTPEYAHI